MSDQNTTTEQKELPRVVILQRQHTYLSTVHSYLQQQLEFASEELSKVTTELEQEFETSQQVVIK